MSSYLLSDNNLWEGGLRLHCLFTARNEGTKQHSGPNLHSNRRQWSLINKEPAQNIIAALIIYRDCFLLGRVHKNMYVHTQSCTSLKCSASISREICVALKQIWHIARELQGPAPASGTGSWQHGGQGRGLPSQGPGPAPSKASRAGPEVAAKASPEPRSPGKSVVTRQIRGQARKAVGPSVSQCPVRGTGIRPSPGAARPGWAEGRLDVSLRGWVRIRGAHGQAQAQSRLPLSGSCSCGPSTTAANESKGLQTILLHKQRNIALCTQEKMTTCFVRVLFGTQNLTKKNPNLQRRDLDDHKGDVGETFV